MEGKIYSAIIGTMRDIGAIGKEQTNEYDKYKFRGIDDVYNALQPAMIKNGIFVVPSVVSMTQEDRVSKQGGNMLHTALEVKYTFFADDGSYVEAIVPGEAADRSDKSINKAMSAAFKYAVFQTFCVPTAEMRDADAESPEIGVQNSEPIKTQNDLNRPITDDQKITILRELDRTGHTVEVIEKAKKKPLSKFTRLDADSIIRQLADKPSV